MKKRWITVLLLTFLSLNLVIAQNQFFEQVNYKGAFGSSNWMQGWTALDEYGFLADAAAPATEVTVTDDDIQAGDHVFWAADNIYVLDGLVYAEAGAVLNIEEGTVIKGKAGTGENASGLIICQDAKIYAEGTAENPIIFTAYSDDITTPFDVDFDTRGQWAGLILLGNAVINETGGYSYIEGISEQSDRTRFGGNDDHDCSGVLRYVSIRHGGTELAPGDEINGLTMGAIGDGTTIEYIEVFSNSDDGYEWFGGTVNCKHLVAAFCGDDAFDHDMGIRSKMQFLFAIQDTAAAGRCGEHDGGHDPEDGTPFAYPVIYNATYLGPGMTSSQDDECLKLRDNWGGEYKNSIFGDRSGIAVDIEQTDSYVQDSKKRLDNGQIVFENNLWFNFAPGNTWTEIGDNTWEANYFSTAATYNEIVTTSPVKAISRAQDGTLDPRPVQGGAAYDDLAMYTGVAEGGITNPNNIPTNVVLAQNYPNPFNPETKIRYTIPQAGMVKLEVFNVLGQKVTTLVNKFEAKGEHNVMWDASRFESGIYFYRLSTASQVVTRKLMLLK